MAEIVFPKLRIDEADMYRLEQIVNKLDAEIRRIAAPCTWTYSANTVGDWLEDNYWSTSCGQKFVILEGSPKENGYNFCPSCGKPLVEFYIQDSEDD
jgi:hypothetical protein